MKLNNLKITNQNSQKGASLIVTIVVLLALTVAALAMTSSNQTQSIMARNSQFRLESFNVSYSEIDAQLSFVNKHSIEDGVPSEIQPLIYDKYMGHKVSSADSEVTLRSVTESDYMERGVAHEYDKKCDVLGAEMGMGRENKECMQMKVLSDTKLKNTTIGSNQHQIYTYVVPKDKQS